MYKCCINCGKERRTSRDKNGNFPALCKKCAMAARKGHYGKDIHGRQRTKLPLDYAPVDLEIRTGFELNRGTTKGAAEQRFIWLHCAICNKAKWVAYGDYKYRYSLDKIYHCHYCKPHGAKHPCWKGGTYKDKQGYKIMKISEEDVFFNPMGKKSHTRHSCGVDVAEHRLVMAKHLGRCLQPWELVHHKNGIKDDNRIENLELTTQASHIVEHNKGYKDGYQKGLFDGKNKQISELKSLIEEQTKHIKLLQWEMTHTNEDSRKK